MTKQLSLVVCMNPALIFWCDGLVIVTGDQQLSPPGYPAPVVKDSWCGNERQKRSGKGKRVVGKWENISVCMCSEIPIHKLPWIVFWFLL